MNEYYSAHFGTLAERIDQAWDDFRNEDKEDKQREKALDFLIFAFDLQVPEERDIEVTVKLIDLMAERNRHKKNNPEYVPGKAPFFLDLPPEKLRVGRTKDYQVSPDSDIAAALDEGDLLDVRTESRIKDHIHHTSFYDEHSRAHYRVSIKEGLFYRHGKVFDTRRYVTHGKKEFAAYTLNANGELSLFNHKDMKDRIAHSSLNKGTPVVAAGEMQIKEGRLIAITTHSGHYQPSLFSVYRLLQYFSSHGVDISQANILTFDDPADTLRCQSKKLKINAYDGKVTLKFHATSATDIFVGIKQIMKNNVAQATKVISDYQRGSINRKLYVRFGIYNKGLTRERRILAMQFIDAMATLDNQLDSLNHPETIVKKIEEMIGIVDQYAKNNNDLSEKHGKNKASGTLNKHFHDYKTRLELIKNHYEMNRKSMLSTRERDALKNIR